MKTTIRSSNGANASWSDDERGAFQRGEWRTDCSHIELRSRDATSPLIYSGPGFLFQDAEHQLRVKIYAVQTTNVPTTHDLLSATSAGGLIPESDYFDLVALDEGGREWHSERHLLDQRTHTVGQVPVLELPLANLWCEQELEVGDVETAPSFGLNFTVFQSLDLPKNANIETQTIVEEITRSIYSSTYWKFEAAGCDFELIPHPLYVEIRVDSPFGEAYGKYPDFPERVLDALFWALGKPVYPAIKLETHNSTLRRTVYSRRSLFPNARHRPPLFVGFYSPHGDLVDTYLRFVLAHNNPRFVWAQLNAVYEASAARFTDAWALTLSVVIESFVNSEFESLAKPSTLEQQWVDEALKHLDAWKSPPKFAAFDARFKERAKGSLRGLKSARINDRLRVLEQAGKIAPGATKAWTEIRNGTAHSYQGGAIKDTKFRAHLAALQVLFYHMFFHALGYRGPFCDFSAPGWPNKTYPDDNLPKVIAAPTPPTREKKDEGRESGE